MYNLLVANEGTWSSSVYECNAYVLGHFTLQKIREKYAMTLTSEIVNELKTFPALFVEKHNDNSNVFIGNITGIKNRDGLIRIKYEIDKNITPFSTSVLLSLIFELDIDEQELNAIHWAIKEPDLLQELSKAGLIKLEVSQLKENNQEEKIPNQSLNSPIDKIKNLSDKAKNKYDTLKNELLNLENLLSEAVGNLDIFAISQWVNFYYDGDIWFKGNLSYFSGYGLKIVCEEDQSIYDSQKNIKDCTENEIKIIAENKLVESLLENLEENLHNLNSDLDNSLLSIKGFINPQELQQKNKQLENENIHLKNDNLEMRAALYKADRLAYLGRMATMMAHNMNQPLALIRMTSSGALSDINDNLFNPETELKPLLEKIIKQTERLNLIMSNFRNFARGDRTVLSAVNLNQVIEDIYQLLFVAQYQLDKIELTKEFCDMPIAYANEFALQEMLISLLSNAREAVKDKTIKQISIKTWQYERQVGFCVEDSGEGMTEEQKNKLFTPFLSSKNEGMGLGLYFCREIVKDLSGSIEYYPATIGGAGFKITLPKQQDTQNGTTI